VIFNILKLGDGADDLDDEEEDEHEDTGKNKD